VRVLIFHGYLLGGTGSNVYNARLAEALVRLGHDVHLLSQDRHPEDQPFVDAAGDWDEGSLRLRSWREPVRCTVYRPNVGALLPVYVADRYEGMQARTFLECSDAEVERYVQANVAAVREVAERVRPAVALANHLIMGPAILARALGSAAVAAGPATDHDVPYAVKVHGSALEYTVKRDPQRFLPYAREGLAAAKTVLVGSRHTAESLWEALQDPTLKRRTRLGPPGVDVERFAPREPAQGRAGLERLAWRLGERAAEPEPAASSTFARDERAAAVALAQLAKGDGEIVAFVGKLIAAKGIDLLLAAWPLVLQSHADTRLAVVGFGEWREHVEAMCQALAEGDLEGVRETALPHLAAFLGGLEGAEREGYAQAARGLSDRVLFTGRLDHEELADLLPACAALVMPSTFPEAFGMVAAEAAACGALPVSARHSGLAEVSDALAQAVPPHVAPWLSFPVDDGAVQAIAQRLCDWLSSEPTVREKTRAGLVATVRERWSWEGVAKGVIAAALGEPEAAPGEPDARAFG
jgi:glycosyltransferase involved in cell wall biosynthesis